MATKASRRAGHRIGERLICLSAPPPAFVYGRPAGSIDTLFIRFKLRFMPGRRKPRHSE
jgi:hypothetical protein